MKNDQRPEKKQNNVEFENEQGWKEAHIVDCPNMKNGWWSTSRNEN
jgi:hypothetical protein